MFETQVSSSIRVHFSNKVSSLQDKQKLFIINIEIYLMVSFGGGEVVYAFSHLVEGEVV